MRPTNSPVTTAGVFPSLGSVTPRTTAATDPMKETLVMRRLVLIINSLAREVVIASLRAGFAVCFCLFIQSGVVISEKDMTLLFLNLLMNLLFVRDIHHHSFYSFIHFKQFFRNLYDSMIESLY